MCDIDFTASWTAQSVAWWKFQGFFLWPIENAIHVKHEESNKHLRRDGFSLLSCMDGPAPNWMDRMVQIREEEK